MSAQVILNSIQVELKIRNYSLETSKIYTHVSRIALRNIRRPLGDLFADGKKSWVSSSGQDRTRFIKSTSVDKHHAFLYPQINLRERRRGEG